MLTTTVTAKAKAKPMITTTPMTKTATTAQADRLGATIRRTTTTSFTRWFAKRPGL